MISEDYSNLPIAIYEQGTFFGDIEVFKNIRRCFSTIALTKLELLAIEKNQFKKIFFREYPSLGHMFLTHFEQKYSSLQEIVELINDFFEPETSIRTVGILQSFKSNLEQMIPSKIKSSRANRSHQEHIPESPELRNSRRAAAPKNQFLPNGEIQQLSSEKEEDFYSKPPRRKVLL